MEGRFITATDTTTLSNTLHKNTKYLLCLKYKTLYNQSLKLGILVANITGKPVYHGSAGKVGMDRGEVCLFPPR